MKQWEILAGFSTFVHISTTGKVEWAAQMTVRRFIGIFLRKKLCWQHKQRKEISKKILAMHKMYFFSKPAILFFEYFFFTYCRHNFHFF